MNSHGVTHARLLQVDHERERCLFVRACRLPVSLLGIHASVVYNSVCVFTLFCLTKGVSSIMSRNVPPADEEKKINGRINLDAGQVGSGNSSKIL